MSKPSHTSKDSYSKSSHFLEHQCSFPARSAVPGKIPDENDCGNCKTCGGCPELPCARFMKDPTRSDAENEAHLRQMLARLEEGVGNENEGGAE